MKTTFSRIGVANDGLGYSTQLSPSSLQLTPMSTKILVVPGKYAYQVGDTVRIILAADTTKFITGKISTITESVTDTTYTIYASAVSALDMSTNYTGWKLSLAGVNGTNGTPGAAGVGYPQLDLTGGSYSYLMQVGNITLTSVTSLTDKGYAVGTNVQLTGLDQTTNDPAAYGYGKITAINSSDITIAVETVQGDMVNNFNSYTLNLSGVRGATGAVGVVRVVATSGERDTLSDSFTFALVVADGKYYKKTGVVWAEIPDPQLSLYGGTLNVATVLPIMPNRYVFYREEVV